MENLIQPPSQRRGKLILFLMVGYFVTTALGFWLLFRHPSMSPSPTAEGGAPPPAKECPSVSQDSTVTFPPPSEKQKVADQMEARKLILQYRAKHPSEINEVDELAWVNKQLMLEGIPFTVTSIRTTRSQSMNQSPNTSHQGGTAIIGAHGTTEMDGVRVYGFANGIDLSPSEKATVKNAEVHRADTPPISPPEEKK